MTQNPVDTQRNHIKKIWKNSFHDLNQNFDEVDVRNNYSRKSFCSPLFHLMHDIFDEVFLLKFIFFEIETYESRQKRAFTVEYVFF